MLLTWLQAHSQITGFFYKRNASLPAEGGKGQYRVLPCLENVRGQSVWSKWTYGMILSTHGNQTLISASFGM